MSLSNFDAMLRDVYLPSLTEQFEATAWMGPPIPPVQGPREPDAVVVFEGTDVMVERRCNGEPVLWIRTGEFYDWEQIDRDDAAELAAALRGWV